MSARTRMAVLGDSIAAGVREPHEGYEDLSWTDRIARALDVETLNLGERNLRAREVREKQLQTALDFRPDLALVVCGGNDALGRGFDAEAVRDELALVAGTLRRAGADVLMLGMLDIGAAGVVTDARFLSEVLPRLDVLRDVTRQVAAAHGARFVDLGRHPAGADASVYASDLLHLNTKGHAIVAEESLVVLGGPLVP